jgi:hypothetical protein
MAPRFQCLLDAAMRNARLYLPSPRAPRGAVCMVAAPLPFRMARFQALAGRGAFRGAWQGVGYKRTWLRNLRNRRLMSVCFGAYGFG